MSATPCFQAVEREQVDSIQPKLQHVNAVGQGLIQSAAKDTDTQALEHDLESTNLQWNSLNKRVGLQLPTFMFFISALGWPSSSLLSVFLSSPGGWANRPTAGGSIALWEVPGCAGASSELAERHGGAGSQPEASLCWVPRCQGPNPRTKGGRCSLL